MVLARRELGKSAGSAATVPLLLDNEYGLKPAYMGCSDGALGGEGAPGAAGGSDKLCTHVTSTTPASFGGL